ncbi:MAG: hypothetical protein HOP29_00485 [Phycisphaerales bacterium]|nr:hypothetical protein [Phycisphaerales bacterium]
MMNVVCKWFATALPACVVVSSLTACREEPPPVKYNVNLGTVDRPLLPTRLPHFDERILTGRADVVPLQDLTAAANGAAAKATPGAASSNAADDNAPPIRSLVQRLRTTVRALNAMTGGRPPPPSSAPTTPPDGN